MAAKRRGGSRLGHPACAVGGDRSDIGISDSQLESADCQKRSRHEHARSLSSAVWPAFVVCSLALFLLRQRSSLVIPSAGAVGVACR